MLKKLYEKSQFVFALAWIIGYVVLASTGDNISADLGIDKVVTLPIMIAMSGVLYFFVSKNGLTEKYGLCRPQLPAAKMLYYIPLFSADGEFVVRCCAESVPTGNGAVYPRHVLRRFP